MGTPKVTKTPLFTAFLAFLGHFLTHFWVPPLTRIVGKTAQKADPPFYQHYFYVFPKVRKRKKGGFLCFFKNTKNNRTR